MAIYLGNQEVGFSNIAPLKPVAMRPDAELIQTYSLDHLLVEDDELTFPTYSTTNKNLLTAKELSPVLTIDFDTYDYYVEEKLLTIPQYSIATLGKGRQDYGCTFAQYEITSFPGDKFIAVAGDKKVADPTYPVPSQSVSRYIYYSSATKLAGYTSVAYGVNQSVQAPVSTSTSLTIKAPTVTIRGNTTYFVNTYYNALTDCRRQYIIRVYRVAKANSSVEGWSTLQNFNNLISDITNNNFTLR